MAASGNLAHPPSPGPRPPRWTVLGWATGVLLLVGGSAAWGAPGLGMSSTPAAAVALGGASLALATLVAYLLLPAPGSGTRAPRAARPAAPTPAARPAIRPRPAPIVRLPIPPVAPEPSPVSLAYLPTAAAQLSASNAVRRAAGVGTLSAATTSASPPSPPTSIGVV